MKSPSPTRPPHRPAPNSARGQPVRLPPELPEPGISRRAQAPMWLVAGFGLALFWASLYLDRNGGGFHPLVFNRGEHLADVEARIPRSEADALLATGRRVYNTYCAACHQPNGRGLPGQFPPIVESEWVIGGGPNRIIRIVLNGLQGPITVRGQEYNNVMLPWRDQLTDTDIAAVITFIRGNKEWGHHTGAVTPAQVKAIRDATASRGTYWTAPELLALPDKD